MAVGVNKPEDDVVMVDLDDVSRVDGVQCADDKPSRPVLDCVWSLSKGRSMLGDMDD